MLQLFRAPSGERADSFFVLAWIFCVRTEDLFLNKTENVSSERFAER